MSRTPARNVWRAIRRRLSLHNRLTLLYSGAMLLVGGVLLTLNWLSVRQVISSRAGILVPLFDNSRPATASVPATTSMTSRPFDSFEGAVLGDLLLRSVIALLLLTACAAFLGRRLASRSIDRLEKAHAAQRVFTAQASHELRTPLTMQRTALEVPLAQGRVPAELQPAIRRALAATARSEELINSLLALARGESGILHPAEIDLGRLVASALTEVSRQIEAMGLTVLTQLEYTPVEGDAPLLAQLVSNLITNAVRHNVPQGEVHIASRSDAAGGRSVLTVVNTGAVLDDATMGHLFTPFHRGSPRLDRPRGSGLGLSVVRAVTEAHGGTVEARRGPGGGLEVQVRLPIRSSRR